jgi:hypothetical protein
MRAVFVLKGIGAGLAATACGLMPEGIKKHTRKTLEFYGNKSIVKLKTILFFEN